MACKIEPPPPLLIQDDGDGRWNRIHLYGEPTQEHSGEPTQEHSQIPNRNRYLPAGYTNGVATGVDIDGNVVGYAYNTGRCARECRVLTIL
jgi:hypothetical protein